MNPSVLRLGIGTKPDKGSPRGVIVKAKDCGNIGREFELQSC